MRLYYVIVCCFVCVFYVGAAEEQCNTKTFTFTSDEMKDSSFLSKIEDFIDEQIDTDSINRNITFDVKLAEGEKKFNTCEINVDGVCYWSHVQSKDSEMSCCDARKICKEHNSILASIPSLKAYDNMTASVREKMHGLPGVTNDIEYRVWIGAEYNGTSKKYSHLNITTEWYPDNPTTKRQQPLVLIILNTNTASTNQGLKIASISERRVHAVLCQLLEESADRNTTTKCNCTT